VEGLFNSQGFTGFGQSRLAAPGPAPFLGLVQGDRPGRLKVRVKRECPRSPGVYGMINERGELIYIGKAKNLRARLLSYFHGSRDDKAGRLVEQARVLAWEPGPSEFAALLRELELIRRWRPRFNVQGQPTFRRRVYVCVGRQPAPYVFLSARPPKTAAALFGPIPAGEQARLAVRRLNDWYRLRDCPQSQEMIFADQSELFPLELVPGCMRHELGHCLAPCAAACTRKEYRGHVAAALAFLRGEDRQPLEMLQREMTEAAEAQSFERAAALRDQLELIAWLDQHLDRLRQAVQHSFVYPVRGHNGSELWYLIRHGRVVSVLPRPIEPAAYQEMAAALQQVFPTPGSDSEPLSLEELDYVLLIASWFRQFPREREATRDPALVLAECVRKNPQGNALGV